MKLYSTFPLIFLALLLTFVPVYGVETPFALGIENLSPSLIASIRPHRVGLVTNQTGVNQSGEQTADILKKHGVNVCALFAPEHGIHGTILAEKPVAHTHDEKIGIPVISLYPSNSQSKSIQKETLNMVDVIVFDIQETGMRHYTYISTLFEIMRAAATFNKKVVVCDRPNPLGVVMEGPLVDPSLESFVSIAPIPVRHGMTIGELALYFNKNVLEKPATLRVIPMKGYERTDGITGELLQPLSPNIACKASCLGYSFLGLVGEVQPIHIGTGTQHAFQLIALPKDYNFPAHQWKKLSIMLTNINIENTPYSYFNTAKQRHFEGLKLHIGDINHLNAFTALLHILSFFKDAGITPKFSSLFDKCVGTPLVRLLFEGKADQKNLITKVNSDLKIFFDQAQHAFLYEPTPRVNNLIL